MPERVVDDLEPVEVEEDHAGQGAAAAHIGRCMSQSVDESHAVGRACQVVT